MTVDEKPAAPSVADPPPKNAPAHKQREFIRIYPRTNLIYWWPVWIWGYCCALITYFRGIGISEFVTASGRPMLFHPDSWLGWSFVAVLMLVIYFTNVRARGIYSFVLIAFFIIVGMGLWQSSGAGMVSDLLSLVRIHLNLAFYAIVSTLILVLWLMGLSVVDRMTWVKFSPGQVIEEHLIGQAAGHVYPSEGLVVRRLPDDFFRHKLLGLRWLGWGTGDFVIRPQHGESLELQNVWNANARQLTIERMVSTRMTDTDYK